VPGLDVQEKNMIEYNRMTLFKLYHFSVLALFLFPFIFMFVESFPAGLYALIAMTGLVLIILDLCLSAANRSEKVAWSLVILLLHWFVLPFYWYAFLRKARYSWCLERILGNPEPDGAGQPDNPPVKL
jgi:hypothetical protein